MSKKILVIVLLFFFVCFASFFPFLSFAAPSAPTLSDEIYADLALRHLLDNVSLYYTNGKSAEDVQLNQQKHWLPASTVKTFAGMYAYKLITEGKLSLTESVTIDAQNDVPTELVTDDLPTLLEGEQVTLARLLRQMLIQSDNTAYNQLLDLLGRVNITNYIVFLGLTHSHVGSKLNLDTSQEQSEFDTPGYGINTTTAEDYAKAFLLIKNKKILGAADLYAILKEQRINTMIPALLPKQVVCAHKTGDLNPLYHDGGICSDSKQSYVLTIFTNAGDPNLLSHLSELIYTKDYNLVGTTIKTPAISDAIHPLDPLVMTTPPQSNVLGATTTQVLTPDITAADLGVKSQDLSLVISDKNLPSVLIPADSPLHGVSDAWQITQKIFANGPQSRRDVDLQTAKLRIAEAKDLVARGKIQQAQALLQVINSGLAQVAKDPSVIHDSSAQNVIQAVSETRFSVLSDTLSQTKGDAKIAEIKNIAQQARETIQNVQPNIPDATNAVNPAQKPLIGEIVKTTDKEITVKTAGGQEITVPTNNAAVRLQERQSAQPTPTLTPPTGVSTTPEVSIIPSDSVTSSPTPSLKSLAVGSTVALIGSTTNNTFSPSLVLTNIPKELAAPVPVTVAKVDTKNNTMVVVENGVYTQVNVNHDTTIKGTDTTISLNQIKQGDVVVVHGEPLTQVQPTVSPTPEVTKGITPNPTQNQNSPGISRHPTSILSGTPPISPSQKPISGIPTLSVDPTTKLAPTSATGGKIIIPTTGPTGKASNIQPTIVPAKPITPSIPAPSTPIQRGPKVIQSTSIQVVEKKADVTSAPKTSTPAPSNPAPSQPKPAAPAQPAAQAPANTNKPAPQPTSAPDKKK